MVKIRFGSRSRGKHSQNENNKNESTSDSGIMTSLSTFDSTSPEDIGLRTPPNTSFTLPLSIPTKSHHKQISEEDSTDRVDVTMTMTSPRKISTTRKVLKFFDSPRMAIFRTPKKKSRRLHLNQPHHEHRHQQEQYLPQNETLSHMETCDKSQFLIAGTIGGNIGADAMTWIHDEAPNDIVPKILSYAGIHKVQAISLTNKSWNRICNLEAVWRTLCEDTQKWVEGRDPEPKRLEDCAMELDNEKDYHCTDNRCTFWKQYYCDNPIVPLDYPTLEAALARVSMRTEVPGLNSKKIALYTLESRSIRIFVQPGLYIVKDRLMVDTVGDLALSIETLDNPKVCLQEQGLVSDSFHGANSVSSLSLSSVIYDDSRASRRTSPTIRDRLSCRSASDDVEHHAGNVANLSSLMPTPKHATIILETKKKNEPIFHIRQGTLQLSKIVMIHYSPGVDIWDGNAAVQIQPRMENERPVQVGLPNKPPTAIIDRSDVMSLSGRGVVAIDGGYTTIRRSHIHNCAATGIYVGGPGSMATVETSDIIWNGNGNERHRRGIARGHSGVYLEQGVAIMTDCNISNNALTGISAVSRDNAILTITDSDLMGNGSLQMEMPPNGTESRRKSVCRDNTLSTLGSGRYRSGLVPAPPANVDSPNGSSASLGSL